MSSSQIHNQCTCTSLLLIPLLIAYAEHPWPYPTVIISWRTALFKDSNTPNPGNFDKLAFNDFDARRTIELPGKSTDEDDDIGVISCLVTRIDFCQRSVYLSVDRMDLLVDMTYRCSSKRREE